MKNLLAVQLIFFLLSTFHCISGLCQDPVKIDSLKNLLTFSEQDTAKVRLLNSLSELFKRNNPDSALHFARQALEISRENRFTSGLASSNIMIGAALMNKGEYALASEALQQSKILCEEALGENPDDLVIKRLYANTYYTNGTVHYLQGDYPEALKNFESALKVREEVGNKKEISDSYISLGAIHWNRGNHPEALKNFISALKIKEEIGDKSGIAACYNNIGEVYRNQNKFKEALQNYQEALKMEMQLGNKYGIALNHNNIGITCKELGNLEEALENHRKALLIRKEIGDKNGIATSYNNIGIILFDLEKYDEALMNHDQALTIREEIGDQNGIAMSYINMGDVWVKKKNTSQALHFLEKGLKLSKEMGIKEFIMLSHLALSETYRIMKDYKNAYDHQVWSSQIKDSILNEESGKQIAEMQSLYESEKKQKEIELLNKEKELQNVELEKKEAEVKKQNTQKIAFGAGFALVLLMALLIFRGYRQKEKSNLLLARQKQQIEIKNSHLETANSEINKQTTEIEEKNHEILASIRYAQRIQQAILPPAGLVKQNLEQSFILYKPKDIVAGDFYWLETYSNGNPDESGKADGDLISGLSDQQRTIFFAAADCTGHGVPGAFVSIVGHNALNRAVKEYGLCKPSEILDKVNEIVRETFSKSENEMKDGMDIALCCLEISSSEKPALLQYSGANNSMYHIRDGVLTEIKADKQPIGNFISNKPFNNHLMNLMPGDAVYVFSDGYADQFGLPEEARAKAEKIINDKKATEEQINSAKSSLLNGKKFKYSRFEKLLVSFQNNSMDEQKEILNREIEKWRGSIEQVDDICIIGVRI